MTELEDTDQPPAPAGGPPSWPRSKLLYGDPGDLQGLGSVDVGSLIGDAGRVGPARVDLSAQNVERGLAQLVVGVVEVLRQVLERQAVRRMEAGALDEAQVERLGSALEALEQRVGELCDVLGRGSHSEGGPGPQGAPSAGSSDGPDGPNSDEPQVTADGVRDDYRQEAS